MGQLTLPDGRVIPVADGMSPQDVQLVMDHFMNSTGATPPSPSTTGSVADTLMSLTPLGMGKQLYNAGKAVYNDPLAAAHAVDDRVRMTANGATFGVADRIAGFMNGTGTDAERAKSQAVHDKLGPEADAYEIGGSLIGPGKLADLGLTASRIPGMVGKYGGTILDGAALGALTAAGNGQDIGTGTAIGAGGGAVGTIFAKLGGMGYDKVSKIIAMLRASPEAAAAQHVFEAGQHVGAPAAISTLRSLGPDAMAVDALGQRGTALGRMASNINPEARSIIETSMSARKSMQNERVAQDLERAAGLPAGNTQNVDALKLDAYSKVKPRIDAEYRSLRQQGYDMPRTPFHAVLTSPMGQDAYEQAAKSLLNRSAVSGEDAASEFARLDMTKRILDSKASMAFRAGDSVTGAEASDLARTLRTQMDNSLVGPEYATARGLRQKAYKTDNAFDMGAKLATGRVPLGMPEKAANIDQGKLFGLSLDAQGHNVAKGYAAKQVENLLNKNATDGALNALSTPQGRKAYEAALRHRAPIVKQAVTRERLFNKTNKELVGNSTTARQWAEMAGGALGGAGVGAWMGYNPLTSGGLTGLVMAALHKGGPALASKITTSQQREMAPFLADLLTRKVIPGRASVNYSKANQELLDKVMRMITVGGVTAAAN